MHLIADAGKRFLAAEHLQNIENTRRGRPPGQRRAERLRNLAELAALSPRQMARTAASSAAGVQVSTLCKPRQESTERLAPALVEQPCSPCSSDAMGRLAKRKAALSSSSTRVLARSFSPAWRARACPSRQSPILRRERRRHSAAPARAPSSRCDDLCVGRGAEIMAVQIFELGEVEARGRAPDGVEIEPAGPSPPST